MHFLGERVTSSLLYSLFIFQIQDTSWLFPPNKGRSLLAALRLNWLYIGKKTWERKKIITGTCLLADALSVKINLDKLNYNPSYSYHSYCVFSHQIWHRHPNPSIKPPSTNIKYYVRKTDYIFSLYSFMDVAKPLCTTCHFLCHGLLTCPSYNVTDQIPSLASHKKHYCLNWLVYHTHTHTVIFDVIYVTKCATCCWQKGP